MKENAIARRFNKLGNECVARASAKGPIFLLTVLPHVFGFKSDF
uniref:Uncharacterized protein n=1 Tax=Rhizophora mucronata TaxID=61149 RepID=A0A2P2NJT6_RHIMU